MFLILLGFGLVLRVLVWLAYQPALLYVDSFHYLANVGPLRPDQLDPIGYDLLVLRPLLAGGLRLVAAVQHLAGLGMAAALYALGLRHGARHWLAALGAAPILLDGYQLQIEQNILSDTAFEALLVAVLWLAAGRGAPRWPRAGAAGLALAVAVLVRLVGITLIVPLLGYLLVAGGARRDRAARRRAWSSAAAALACFAAVLGGYAAYFQAQTGRWGLSPSSGNVLYGRTAQVADCSRLRLDPVTAQMCPGLPLGRRPGVDVYAHRDGDPSWPAYLPPGTTVTDLQHAFAVAVLRAQPLDVLGGVLTDFAKGFAPTRTTAPGDVPVERWQFQTDYPRYLDDATTRAATLAHDGTPPEVNRPLATFLRGYQRGAGYTPGPLLAAAALLGLAGGLAPGRARRSGIRSATLLVTACGLGVLLTAAAFEFSWRYQLPGLALLPLAGVLGATALGGPLRRPAPPRPRARLADFPDPTDLAALRDFADRYGEPRFAPVLVVVAAYNEAVGLGAVLDAMPTHCLGLSVDVLVVVDGATDGTAEVALAHGAYTCVAPRNRGQGAALRLGYRLAERGGARYVVTTDADGQYDNAEMPRLVRPLVDGDADFVTGSRRLGREGATSRVRWLGVRVFAVLASVLTARRITDTSFGFRAMRSDLAAATVLREPQYQSAELLLGVLAGGGRVLEVPATMRPRRAGRSKKGGNLRYGANYARVMLTAWARGWLPRRRVPARAGTPAGPAPRT
nr:glycosyltransferase family 2 protein [Gandjariella thermophila]